MTTLTTSTHYTPTEIHVLRDSFAIRITLDEKTGNIHEDVGTGIVKSSPIPIRIPIPEPLGIQLFGRETFVVLQEKARRAAVLQLLHQRLDALSTVRLTAMLRLTAILSATPDK